MTIYGWIWEPELADWVRVCSGDGYTACARCLGEIGRGRGVPTLFQAMTGGSKPGFTPRTKDVPRRPGCRSPVLSRLYFARPGMRQRAVLRIARRRGILEPFDFRLFQDLGAACDQATR
jgi:hypothetical protein